MTQKAEKHFKLWKSLRESFAGFDPSYHMDLSHLVGTYSWLLFSQEFASIIPESIFERSAGCASNHAQLLNFLFGF